jgi:predicted transcriptional regulator of viral defense system
MTSPESDWVKARHGDAENPTPRTLSKREAELVGWIEAERRPSVTTEEVRQTLGWPDHVTNIALARLATKGWLRRTAKGRYETVLADTGGWSLPNPWAALSSWRQPYYVGFKSAAYERQLTPDRPGRVQACVPVGAKPPLAWKDVPVTLIYLPAFSDESVEEQELHQFRVRIASVEKILVDSGAHPGHVGGVLGLARIVDRAVDRADWAAVVKLASHTSRGRASLRRLGALLKVLGHDVPEPLAREATARPGETALYLGDRKTHGARGERLPEWNVVVNVDPAAIAEEVRR